MEDNKKTKDPLAEILRDVAERIVRLEKDVRRLEDVSVEIIGTQKELIAIVRRLSLKYLQEEDKTEDLENLYR